MKTIKLVTLALLATCMISWNNATAQDGNFYTVTTWKMEVPEGGSRAEMNALLEEFGEKIVKKNTKVISQKVMHHVSGSDLRDVVVISEYASWNDIDAAGTMQDELVMKAWPDEKARDAWMESFMKYVVTHSDEIYQEYPKMTK
ncbi:hypothetical protein G3O08_01435 [Cryomorpha ignava]|uniref:NIPSNAP domain-containing protein n=1 Tax=Cryomorpha ignava TaxID=101383 RepID=A0A7K3WKZ5_9FLAO|nr:hypothetical protein [Cryomorpha ignava]NEN22164.1 hypothetical protein [Cryomorpha ignava]